MNLKDNIPLNVMIVEDEEDLCFLLSVVLIQKNLHPLCVFTIADAKKSIEKINPSLIFLDDRLPDGKGIDYITEVKQHHPSIKIVMITAHNSLQEIRCAINRGADYFITKPFDSATIRNIIDLLIPQKAVDISYK